MNRVMVPPIGTEVASEKFRTGLMDAAATPPEVIEKKAIEVPIEKEDKAIDISGSALVCN